MTVTGDGRARSPAPARAVGGLDRRGARASPATSPSDLGMTPFEIADEDRAAYHAAASIASNFLVTLEAAAERLLGHDRELLVPLVRATVENWAALGAERALTGPIARGDEATVERQRARGRRARARAARRCSTRWPARRATSRRRRAA